jgi:hypothetical protein
MWAKPDSPHCVILDSVQRMGRGVLVVGAAVLCGIVGLVLTAFVLLLLHSHIIFGVCATSVVTTSGVSHFGPQVCSPQSWQWVLSAAGVVGAGIGGLGTFLLMRHGSRLHERDALPVGQLSDCISPRPIDSWM